ncbi:MAG: OmpA family protein [Nitrospiraceae bacterium]|nr:OmpA family protein [Nitrospiraceae bacterium]
MRRAVIGISLCIAMTTGCISEDTYLKTQEEAEKARKALAQQTATLESLKSQTGKEKQELVDTLTQEKTRAAQDLSAAKNDLAAAQASLAKVSQELESQKKEVEAARAHSQRERERREALESELTTLQDSRALRDENSKLKRDIEHVEHLLQSSQHVVANNNRALEEANRRLAAAAKEKERLAAALTEAQNHARNVESKLISEQAAAIDSRQEVEEQAAKLRAEYEQLQQRHALLKQERDRLQAKSDGLQRHVQTAQQEAASRQSALEEATARLDGLTHEREQLMTALAGAQQQVRDFDAKLTAGQTKEGKTRQSLEGLVGKLQGEHEQLWQRSVELRQERDQLQAKADDLSRALHIAQQDVSVGKKALEEANGRLAALSLEKEHVTAALTDTRNQVRDQESKLSAEQAKAAALNEHMQTLTARTMKAEEEIARLEKQVGQLEAEKARGEELAMRLSERDQQIGSLRQAVSDRDSVAGRVVALTEKLDAANQRITELTAELSSVAERAILAEEDRDRLTSHVAQQQAALANAEHELDRLRQEQTALQTALQQQEERDQKALAAEKTRLEQERVAKKEGSQRLAKTQEELSQALQSEIAKGEALVQPTGDRLTMIVIDRVLFDSGSVKIKPDGLKVLKRISEVLKTLPDKHIRVEGHTDNVPMASRFRERYPTNWEFSIARATSVVRYLIEQGGLNREQVSASGHADTKPIAANDSEEGRAANRRIEITLIPKDQTVVASQAP